MAIAKRATALNYDRLWINEGTDTAAKK